MRIEADLERSDAHITFSHSGAAFSAENIRFLVEQVSSKSRTTDRTGRPTTTGKFRTGFLTTYLLSPYVLVTGVARQKNLLPRKFELYLDAGERQRARDLRTPNLEFTFAAIAFAEKIAPKVLGRHSSDISDSRE